MEASPVQENKLMGIFQVHMIQPVMAALKKTAKLSEPTDDYLNAIEAQMSTACNVLISEITGKQTDYGQSEELSLNRNEQNSPPSDLSSPKSAETSSSLKSDGYVSPAEDERSSYTQRVLPDVAKIESITFPRRKAKRSLEDTVQKLSDQKNKQHAESLAKRSPQRESLQTHPNQSPTLQQAPPIVFPPVVPPAMTNDSFMSRWMATQATVAAASSIPMISSTNMYLNVMNILHSQNALSNYLSKIGLNKQQPNSDKDVKTASIATTPPISERQSTVDVLNDVKIDVDSDEVETSPSPSNTTRCDNSGDFSEVCTNSSTSSSSHENDSDKPFVCENHNCYKRFANKFLLKKHQFIHTGLRPHHCPYCSKKFNRKDNLLRHKKTHLQSGESNLNKLQLSSSSLISPSLTGFPSSTFVMDSIKIDNFKFQLELAKLANPQLFGKKSSGRTSATKDLIRA